MHCGEEVGRQRRRRHSSEFQAEAVAVSQKLGVSMTAEALSAQLLDQP